MASVGKVLGEALKELQPLAPERLRELRREKFLAMGREALH
jgi:acetyl-CoA carboxylase carboxyl transferase subunit alpha